MLVTLCCLISTTLFFKFDVQLCKTHFDTDITNFNINISRVVQCMKTDYLMLYDILFHKI